MGILLTILAIVVVALLLSGAVRLAIGALEYIVTFLLGLATVGAIVAMVIAIAHIIF